MGFRMDSGFREGLEGCVWGLRLQGRVSCVGFRVDVWGMAL